MQGNGSCMRSGGFSPKERNCLAERNESDEKETENMNYLTAWLIHFVIGRGLFVFFFSPFLFSRILFSFSYLSQFISRFQLSVSKYSSIQLKVQVSVLKTNSFRLLFSVFYSFPDSYFHGFRSFFFRDFVLQISFSS